MVFYTASKSVYELDAVNNRIRRLRGVEDPSPRQGQDGQWGKYATISPIVKGLPVLIMWTSDVHTEPGIIPSTLTSAVEDICPVEN